ncbi:MAG: hypothetical protein HYR89_08330 [Actinobacteria bacterium]|nr:hypothetical protein [Actinomycetota bacterium]
MERLTVSVESEQAAGRSASKRRRESRVMSSFVTLRLDGSVTVANFAKATSNFAKVLTELSKERDAGTRIEWVISGLEYGSAILTAAPLPVSDEDAELVPTLVLDFIAVARHVSEHPAQLDRPVLRLVRTISEIAVDEDHEVVFETADEEVAFVHRNQGGPSPVRSKPVLGMIRGRVQTLQQRKGLRFVLYDLVHDKAVTCYLTEDQEDLMRDAWGRMVEVTGMITRDEITDRPRAIRRVADVQVLEEGVGAFAFRRARGAVSPAPGSPASEVLIRRVRDAV